MFSVGEAPGQLLDAAGKVEICSPEEEGPFCTVASLSRLPLLSLRPESADPGGQASIPTGW